MATTSDLPCSGTTCVLLLPQLVQIWLPDDSAVRHERCSTPLSEQALRSHPPLISFLEGLSDVLTPDDDPGKRLPCGHVVSLRAMLACCNFCGDESWTPGPHLYGCAEEECSDTFEFPRIPDPRVVDGLEARLQLIEWSWKKDKPNEPDMRTVSLLRDFLSQIGHLSRELEPETDDKEPRHEPSETSLMQTLVQMETEALGLMAESEGMKAETAVRGTQDYCSYRASRIPRVVLSQLQYPMLSPGQACECVTAHEFEREPGTWALTPAEMDLDHSELTGKKITKSKTVRFAAPVVTEVQYFELWWNDEYRDSDRYWSQGPHRRSMDLSTSADDDWEILRLDDPEGFEAKVARILEEEDSESDTVFGDAEVPEWFDAESLDEMDRDEGEGTLEDVERVDESREEETVDNRMDLDELGECF